MARLATANDIINRVAIEIGLNKDVNPVASEDESFVRLRGLLDSAGQELVQLNDWQIMQKSFTFTTAPGDDGNYDLPTDFSHMIDQTGWDRTNNVPLGGPLSSQDWAYLAGRDLVDQSIYVSFQLSNNRLSVYPQPPPAGLNISFEYQSRNWIAEQAQTNNRHDIVQTGSDLVLYEPILIVKFLKVKMLEATGFDASAARLEFDTMYDSISGKDEGASVLNASGVTHGFPYISPYRNTGDTGFGG